MTAPVVVAVDPGPRWTGLIVRRGDDYLAHELLRRRSKGRIPEPAYGAFVIARIEVLLVAARDHDGREPLLIVEAANGPTGFKDGSRAPLNPIDVFALGLVIGAVLAHFPDAQVVPPGGHGSGLLVCYPPELRGPREHGPVGTGVLRHCRSAWDVAGLAQLPQRLAVLTAVTSPAGDAAAQPEPAAVISSGGLTTTGLVLIRPGRRQGHHRTQPEGGDAA